MGNSCSAQTFCEYNATLDKPILFQADPDVVSTSLSDQDAVTVLATNLC